MSDEKDQSPVEKSLRKPFEFVNGIKKFRKTQKAVIEGIPLYDWTSAQRQEKGFFDPWPFNIFESVLASIPVFLFLKIFNLIFDRQTDKEIINYWIPKTNSVFPQLNWAIPDMSFDKEAQVAIDVEASLNVYFDSIITPVLLTLIVFIVGWASLKKIDFNNETRARARRAYLYLDGAYGLFAQSAIALSFAFIVSMVEHPKVHAQLPNAVIVIGGVIFLFSIGVQLYLTFYKVPKALFKLNGYSGRIRKFWQKKMDDDPPLCRYVIILPFGFIITTSIFLMIWGIVFWCVVEVLTAIKLGLGN